MFRNRALITAITTAMICSAAAAKADQILYCTDELATGFSRENGAWKSVRFRLERFTLKVEGDFEALIYEGDKYSCVQWWMASGDSPISCNRDSFKPFSITIDKYSLRYVRTFPSDHGFVSSKHISPVDDAIFAGTCETF